MGDRRGPPPADTLASAGVNLLHVVPSYWPAHRYGGTVTAVHGLCKALVGLGHRVVVLTTNADGRDTLDVPVDRPVSVDGVDVYYFPLQFYRWCYAPAMRSALREQVAAADLVHVHSVFLWPTWAAARRARRCGVPYVVSPRGMLVGELIRRRHAWLKRAWIACAEAATLRNAAAIHVTSDVERRELAALGLRLPRVEVIGNGVDAPAAPASVAATADDEPIILYLGRLSWKKGLDRLMDALPQVARGRLVIAGNDEERYGELLQRRLDVLGVRGRVEFAGPVYGEAKWTLLRNAACLVLPSYSENFGNVVLEAMAVGCPVVLTPEVGAADLVREAGAGLVVDGDAAGLARAIRRFIEDDALRAAAGAAGIDAARDRHAWPACARKMAALYRQVSGAGGAHATCDSAVVR